tara:strand:+ start:3475 stop:3783 length:309 start_codon:yes stop_codon:yes gene_type:complete
MLLKHIFSILLLASPLCWADATPSIFLYSLDEPLDDELHHPITTHSADKLASKNDILKIDYEQPCDVKCGVRNTGLFMLQMLAEAREDEVYRSRLIMPNFEQ